MKSFRMIACAAMVGVGVMAGRPAAFAIESPPSQKADQPVNPPDTVTVAPNDALKAAVAAIERAPDPSSAVAAYAKGAASDPNGITLERAYILRLVKLGLPELAEAQARDLSKRRPDDGVAMAVVAYTDARKGNTTAALQEILIADRQAGDDPFVQRTAAQLLAYYDYKADHPQMDADVRAQLEQMRTKLGGTPGYAEAYDKAADAYAQEPPDQSRQPPTPPATPNAVVPPIYVSPPPVYNYTYNTYANDYAPYTDPFACSYAAYPWWPSWWGWGPSLVVIDRSFTHRHFGIDHGHFGHGDFGHRDFGHRDFGRHDAGHHDPGRHDFGHMAFGHNVGRRDGQIGDIGSIGFRSSAFAGRSLGSTSVGVRRSLPTAGGFRSTPTFRSAPRFGSSPTFRSLPSRGGMTVRGGSFGGRMGGGASAGRGSMGGGRR